MNPSCKNSQLCVSSPKPIDILLRKQPPAITASFFERMKFLIDEGSLQNYARQETFNERWVISKILIFSLITLTILLVSPELIEMFNMTSDKWHYSWFNHWYGNLRMRLHMTCPQVAILKPRSVTADHPRGLSCVWTNSNVLNKLQRIWHLTNIPQMYFLYFYSSILDDRLFTCYLFKYL